MSTTHTPGNDLREFYASESARIREEFSARSDGRAAVQGRAALVDSISLRLWKELISPDSVGPQNFTLVALGGFGRRWLFPYSDIDILFLHAGGGAERNLKERVARFSQEIWDLRLKLSPATRTLAECEKFDPNNVEFAISLLDCRYLAGDKSLFDRLHDQLIPKLVARESRAIVQRLTDLTHGRYNKFGNTVFHLEPNVKDGPGGLRDYNLAHWLALIAAMEEQGAWPDEKALLPLWLRERFDAALDFLMSVRCFLHFRHGRDDNTLAWLAQDEAAAEKIGAPGAGSLTASDWMRIYFGHARLIHRVGLQLLEEFPAARPSLYRQFQNLRSRLSNAEFAVVDGRIFLQRQETPTDSELPLRMFRFMARHGLSLSSSAEHQIEEIQPALAAAPPKGAQLWHYLQEILVAPHAAQALRTCLRLYCRNFRQLIRLSSATILIASQWTSTASSPLKISTPCESPNPNGTRAIPNFSTNSSSRICCIWRCYCTTREKAPSRRITSLAASRLPRCPSHASIWIHPTAKRFFSSSPTISLWARLCGATFLIRRRFAISPK
jgi:[protein-PII] uridylyltransferase